jgi:hypothetical protein
MALCVPPTLKTGDRVVRFAVVSSAKERRHRVRLASVMILIAVIAVSLRLPIWLDDTGFRPLAWWESYRIQKAGREASERREKATHDAWNGPIAIQVARHDELGSFLANFTAATAREGLPWGLQVYVDREGLTEVGRTLNTPIGIDLDTKSLPARHLLDIVLERLRLACKLEDKVVMVTSKLSIDEPIDYGHHGEAFCKHGERVNIRTLNLRLPVSPIAKPSTPIFFPP